MRIGGFAPSPKRLTGLDIDSPEYFYNFPSFFVLHSDRSQNTVHSVWAV
jgi:hypothetical protein